MPDRESKLGFAPNVVLSDIFIYPIKSLGGIRMASWPVTHIGFKYDRQWMLVDGDCQFLSQRRLPRMTLIKTVIDNEHLVVTAPDMADLRIELEPQTGTPVRSTIWGCQIDTLAVSAAADAWFSRFLQMNCRLVYQPASVIRLVNPEYAKPGDQTALSDGFPFLLISEGSLASLNDSMGLQLPMSRFRPNLVVSGCESYAEDRWREIMIGDIGFRLPKPCSRCSVTTVDTQTGETGKEPLTTLNRLRNWQGKVYFGQNALHDGVGMLSIGDKVTIKLNGDKQPSL